MAQASNALDFRLDDLFDKPNRELITSALGKEKAEDLIREMQKDYSTRVDFPPSGVNLHVLVKANEVLRKRLIAASFQPYFCRSYTVESLVRLHAEVLSIYHY